MSGPIQVAPTPAPSALASAPPLPVPPPPPSPSTSGSMSSSMSPSSVGRVRAFLQRRPVLCLLLLTPGIVEYLTGSSSLSLLILLPPVFFAFLGLNLALYGPGVLLIREAMVRWKKGWASVLLMGAAYAILEEGIALNTLFDSYAGPVGALGFYGHWAGVNWVWTAGLLIVHALWSIALPILLLGLALPETRGKSLLTPRGIRVALVVLAADVLLLLLLVGGLYHFYAGPVLLAGSFLAIGGLVYAAYRAPADLLSAASPRPRASPLRFAVVGAAFFPIWLLAEDLPMAFHAPPYAAVLSVIAVGGLWLVWILKNIGREDREPQLVALGAGLVAPFLPFGIIVQLHTGIGLLAVVGGDLAAVLFFHHLWRKYRPRGYASGTGPSPRPSPSPGPTGMLGVQTPGTRPGG